MLQNTNPVVELEAEAFVVIIVNWNSAHEIVQLVKSFPHGTPYIVIDNLSADFDLLSALREDSGLVAIRQAESNLGYGGGMNIGIKMAMELGFRWVLMLNPDVHPNEDVFDSMAKLRSTADVIGIQQYKDFGDEVKRRYACAGSIIDGWKVSPIILDPGEVREVDVVTGAAILARTELIAAAGFFDEDYFHYKEEFDLTYKIKSLGGRIYVTSKAELSHDGGVSLSHHSPMAVFYAIRNDLMFLRKRSKITPLRLIRIVFRNFLNLGAYKSWSTTVSFVNGIFAFATGQTGKRF